MNLQQAEKLKGLIQASGILSSQEKAEWQALLELMDDKQMGELEKILASAPAPKISNEKLQISNAPQKPNPIQNQTPSLPQSQMPHLSHILNLPSNWNGQGKPPLGGPAAAPQKSQAQTQAPAKPVEQNQTSGFAAKLKAMVSEKELTAGKPSKEELLGKPSFPLELSSPAKRPEPLAQKPKPSETKPVDFGLRLKETSKPVSPLTSQLGPVPMPPKPPTSPAVKPAAEPLPKAVLTSASKINSNQPEIKPIALPKLNSPYLGTNKAVFAGAVAKNTAPETTIPVKEHLQVQSQSAAVAGIQSTQAPALKDVPVESMQDVATLSIRALQISDLDSLAEKIKTLRHSFGYFDVIMNLEKSPAYKAYMDTGLKLLSEETSFEQLAEKTTLSHYLSKDQFEKFTDLLVKIQAA